MEYTIVGSAEADPYEGKISNESPVGSAFIRKKDRRYSRSTSTRWNY